MKFTMTRSVVWIAGATIAVGAYRSHDGRLHQEQRQLTPGQEGEDEADRLAADAGHVDALPGQPEQQARMHRVVRLGTPGRDRLQQVGAAVREHHRREAQPTGGDHSHTINGAVPHCPHCHPR